MDRKYEGYSYPVQELLNKGHELTGICGVVGDLLEVPEDYRVAVEVALGSGSIISLRNVQVMPGKLFHFSRNGTQEGLLSFL